MQTPTDMANTDIDMSIVIEKFKWLIEKSSKSDADYKTLGNLLNIILSRPEYLEKNKALNQYLHNLIRYHELRNKPCEELTSSERDEESKLAIILHIPSH